MSSQNPNPQRIMPGAATVRAAQPAANPDTSPAPALNPALTPATQPGPGEYGGAALSEGPHETAWPLFHYRACALDVASAIPLSSLVPAADHTAPVQVRILPGRIPSRLDGDILASGPIWEMNAREFLLTLPAVGTFLIRDKCEIRYEAAPGVPPAELAAFLTGTVMGILLHLRGGLVLHGSAVRVVRAGPQPGTQQACAVIVCGPSGAGKSTLAAALGKRGYAMLSDDLSVLFEDERHGLVVHPDGRRHKLWEDAIEALSLENRQGERVRTQLHKFHVEPDRHVVSPLPLAAVYELGANVLDDTVSCTSVNLPDTAAILRRNAYRPQLMWQLDQKGAYFKGAARVARLGGAHILNRPIDFNRMPAVIDALEAHWRSLGILADETTR